VGVRGSGTSATLKSKSRGSVSEVSGGRRDRTRKVERRRERRFLTLRSRPGYSEGAKLQRSPDQTAVIDSVRSTRAGAARCLFEPPTPNHASEPWRQLKMSGKLLLCSAPQTERQQQKHYLRQPQPSVARLFSR